MNLFRSEEHLIEWLASTGYERGGTMTVATCWQLARTWYGDKGRPGYRRRTPEEAQAIFDSLGLTGPFWQLRV
jgi:hypothetical protein